MNPDHYQNPLIDRYASTEMAGIWSPKNKFTIWRRLWIALAKVQKDLGLKITDDQITEMEKNIEPIDFELAKKKEKEIRHDVMSHVFAFGVVCPKAKPIIHLGATSCYITDNTELIQIKQSLQLIRSKLLKILDLLKGKSLRYKGLPTLGFTHYQPAQLTTVGKRFSLWLNDFLMDFLAIDHQLKNLPFRGAKGTTGTQASFLNLFGGDHQKVTELDSRISKLMGFSKQIPVCGQTYSRKIDFQVLSELSGTAQSAHKMAGDIRLLMNLKELEEPFEKSQVGSSAMAYKRNPMRCERICSLARYVLSLTSNPAHTHANQWMERTLDDSANRRISLPQSFLATDAILLLVMNVSEGVKVWPEIIKRRIAEELPFMATENIIMECVKAGGDRQELHEAIRVHSMESARVVKEKGLKNDLLNRIASDKQFHSIHHKLKDMLNPKNFIGRSPQQVDEFIETFVQPILKSYPHEIERKEEDIRV